MHDDRCRYGCAQGGDVADAPSIHLRRVKRGFEWQTAHRMWSNVPMLAIGAALTLSASCIASVVAPDKPTSNASIFDELWSDVDVHYPFFELKRTNWDSIGAVYKQYAIKAPDKGALQAALATLLRELHDPHVVLFEEFGPIAILRYQGRADTVRTFYNADFVFAHYLPTTQITRTDVVHAGMINATVGYVRIDDFLGTGELAQLDASLRSVASATSIIVDVRNNLGGDYLRAIDMAGRFVLHEQTFGYLRFRNGKRHTDLTAFIPEVVTPSGAAKADRPVFVLTNSATASSAEVFVLALRSNAKITVLGDTTAGMSGGPTARELSNGWIYRISEWIEYTPAKVTYESVGLPPNVFVRARESDVSRGTDPVIERALALAAASK